MQYMTKISMFDKCINGNDKYFESLSNDHFDDFNRFYKSYKNIFSNREDFVNDIVYNEEDSLVSFSVSHTSEDEFIIDNTDKTIEIISVDKNTIHFNVHPNKV